MSLDNDFLTDTLARKGKRYLGDGAVLAALLNDTFEKARATKSSEELDELVTDVARVLLGENAEYSTAGQWNTLSGIATHVHAALELKGAPSLTSVRVAVAAYIQEVAELHVAYKDDPQAIGDFVNDVTTKTVRLFLGVPEFDA